MSGMFTQLNRLRPVRIFIGLCLFGLYMPGSPAQVTVDSNQVFVLTQPQVAGSHEYIDILQEFILQPGDLQTIERLYENRVALVEYATHRLSDEARSLSVDEVSALMSALSLINDERALNAFLALAEGFSKDSELSQSVLLMLRDMPVTAPVLAYVDNLIETNRNKQPELVRSALMYYLAVRNNAGMRWAGYYRSPGIDPQLRFAGLALAAALIKDDQVTRWILAELTNQPAVPRYQQYYLLQALHTSVTEAEFDQLLPGLSVAPTVIKEFQRLRDFNTAAAERKQTLAGYMLASPYRDQQQLALKYYIINHSVMEVWPRLDTTRRLSAIRISHALGVSILPEAEAVNEQIPDASSLSTGFLWGVLCILAVLFIIFIYMRIRTTHNLRNA